MAAIRVGAQPAENKSDRGDDPGLGIIDEGYFYMPGLHVLVYNNTYPEGHQGGVEIIQHGERAATNGELQLPQSRQPLLKTGHSYVLELQGVGNSAPLFWYRTSNDLYSDGAAYRDRSSIKQDSNTSDFGMALHAGTNQDL